MSEPLHQTGMERAIEKTRQGMVEGQTPFGAAIRLGDRWLAVEHNTTVRDADPTCHAEINAIRTAAKVLGRSDLRGCVLYSTCEPCPMCFAAAHWAGIDEIHFGSDIDDSAAAGFDELRVYTRELVARSGRISVHGGRMREACLELFREFAALNGEKP